MIEQQAQKLDLRLSEYVRLCVLSDLAARAKNDAKETSSAT
jgi:hypothetical protein